MQDPFRLTTYLDGAFAQVSSWQSVSGVRTVVAVARRPEDATPGALDRPDGLVGYLVLPSGPAGLDSPGRQLMATILARGGTMILVCGPRKTASLHLFWLKWCGVTVQHLSATLAELQHA